MRILILIVFLTSAVTPAWGYYLVTRTTVADTTFVTVIDTEIGAIESRIPVPPAITPLGGKALGIAWDWDNGIYFFVDDFTDRIWTLAADLQTADERFTTPPLPGGLTTHDGSLFLKVNSDGSQPDRIYRLDSLTGAIEDSIAVPDSVTTIQDLTSDGSHLWAVDSSTPRVWRIDPSTELFELYYPLPSPLFSAIAWDPENEWLWFVESATQAPLVYRMDPTTGHLSLEFTLDDGEDWYFYPAMVFRQNLTPTRNLSWGAVKDRYRSKR